MQGLDSPVGTLFKALALNLDASQLQNEEKYAYMHGWDIPCDILLLKYLSALKSKNILRTVRILLQR